MGLPKYYTPREVSSHSCINDVWVSYLGEVHDLTSLVQENKGNILIWPIITSAGKDISHWFDPETKDIRTHIDPMTGCKKYYTPYGRFLHIPPPLPRTDWQNDFGCPWWKDRKYHIGSLTIKTRNIRIINTLTSQENTLEVCSEDTMMDILEKCIKYNSHINSYTWKYDSTEMDMSKTLEENGVRDEDDNFFAMRMERDDWIPAIHLYYNDDLTEL
uniref:Cytochrome b5 domain-containing protein 1 n=1 Tax=Erpetoichthys calabaricus TaxID=27687 RepID=A0A8C4SCZ6_ERPCA